MTDEKEKKLTAEEQKLIDKACKAYGIDPKFVLASRIDKDDRAVILTHGGSRVRYADGDEKAKDFEPLTEIQVDGIIRKKPRHLIGKKKTEK